ncbi:MAG: thiamine pyrophosphate-binding protein [Cytophagales bacterium]|nr:thiamine pyrophosphate-binding protein [Cytophagales bacterium]
MSEKNLTWVKVLENADQLLDERVMTVTAGHKSFCLTHHEGKFGCLDNKCPHQGGPLGEGSIENGLLRCPWHGWDYDPISGKAPGFDDGVESFPVEIRDDGVYIQLEEEAPQPRTVSDVMIETMVNAGVDTVFGMVGHSNLGVADAMRKQERAGRLKYFGIRHEGAAAFAASAYGKLTGKPAACFGIAGPGATNMYTGMWDAKNDRAPLLALSGQVQTQVVGTGAFQEVDLVAAFEAVADFNHRTQSDSKHAELMNLAVKHAIVNRDVSHITFPDDVQILKAEGKEAGTMENRIANPKIEPAAAVLAEAIEKIKASKTPTIIVGHGARFEMDRITELAERLNAPVLTTFKGKGLISDSHPLGCGVLGRSGTPIASYFMNEADLLLVFGASFSNHTGITPKIPTIQVDFDRLALAKFHSIDVPIWAELGVTADKMLQGLKGQSLNAKDQKPAIAERWSIWRAEKQVRLKEDNGNGVSSVAVFEAMKRHVKDDAAMAVDVGNNTYSFGRYFECEKQSIVMSGYLGSIGFGYPAAMGLWAAVGDSRQIIAVTGDGGFGQYPMEVTTAVKYNMPIKHILLNNKELGKISKEQRAAEFDVWQTSLVNPDFAAFVSSTGALGIKVTKASELDEALDRLMKHDGPGTVEIMTDAMLI